MTLGEKIQNLRNEKSLSQKQLALILNTTIANIAMWEANEEIPSSDDIKKLCEFFNITDSELTVSSTGIHCTETNNSKVLVNTKKKISKTKKKMLLVCIPILVLLFFVISAFVLFPFSKNTRAIEKATLSIVKIYCFDFEGEQVATGSGFIVFDDQTIVTNYHVMENAYTCKISTDEDKTYEVESILKYSKEEDLAILKLKESTGLPVLNLGNSETIKKGEAVVAIGSPLGIKNTVSQGVLSGRIMDENMDMLQFTASISSGSSGGALFDDTGRVIGVTFASYNDGQNLNLAIPVECVKTLYNKPGTSSVSNIIYLIEHPYVNYLDDYKHAVEVSFGELKKHPQKYSGKTIKIKAFVSSVNNGDLRYITTERYISNDFDSDFFSNIEDFENTPHILAKRKDSIYNEKQIETNLQAGDLVCVIGDFYYSKKGESYKPLDGYEFTRKANHGEIKADIIYKID